MRTVRVFRILLATSLAPALVLSPLAGQRSGPVRTSVLPETRTTPASLIGLGQSISPGLGGQTTFLERAAWGAGVGFVGVVAASALLEDGDPWIAIPMVGAASAMGVMMVTAQREGTRPVSTVIGTALAMTIPGLVLANMERSSEGPGPELFVGFALLLSAPLGAAAGHGLGAR